MLVIFTRLKPKTKYSFQLSNNTGKFGSALVSQNDNGRGIRTEGQEARAASGVTDQPCHRPAAGAQENAWPSLGLGFLTLIKTGGGLNHPRRSFYDF